jgi:hypothetical protein
MIFVFSCQKAITPIIIPVAGKMLMGPSQVNIAARIKINIKITGSHAKEYFLRYLTNI